MSVGEWLGYAYLGGCALGFIYFIVDALYEYFYLARPRDHKFGYALTCPLAWIIMAVLCMPALNIVVVVLWAITSAYRYVADRLDGY